MALRRISKEIQLWENQDGIFAAPDEDNVFHWKGVIVGPENSLYENGVYRFTVKLPTDYPFKPPEVKIDTRIRHMNICAEGCHVCTPDQINLGQWSPNRKIIDVLRSIRSALSEPFTTDRVFDIHLLKMYRLNRDGYGRYIRAHVLKHAVPISFDDTQGIQYEFIHNIKGVPSLQYQCRKAIRFTMKLRNPWDITEDIETLPLPRKLKLFLK